MLRSVCLTTLAIAASQAGAHAAAWQGEGSLAAGFSSGNSNTSDAGIGFKTERDGYDWRTEIEANVDYGETDGVESKNRTFVSTQADRKMASEIWSAHGRTSYERDQIAGLDRRIFLGLGVGYEALTGGDVTWSLNSSPGYKFERRIEKLHTGDIAYSNDDTFALQAGSNLDFKVNSHVSVSNKSDLIYSEESTQITNKLSLTAALVDNISARISFDVRHDTSPLEKIAATDTTTRISLVYGFGG